jgi:hypothetical protein
LGSANTEFELWVMPGNSVMTRSGESCANEPIHDPRETAGSGAIGACAVDVLDELDPLGTDTFIRGSFGAGV